MIPRSSRKSLKYFLGAIQLVNGRIWFMDPLERRVIGSLFLLSGLTFLAVGLYTGQLTSVLELLKKIFETAIAGLP
jgi:hypothetical protein